RWLQASDVASEHCDTLRDDLERISSDISFLNGALTSLRERYRGIREASGVWTHERKERLSELKQSEQDRTKKVGDLETEYKQLQKQLESHRSRLSELLTELGDINGTLNNMTWDLETDKREENKLEELIVEGQKQLSTKKDICPVCKQPWTSSKATAHRKKLRSDVAVWKKKQQVCSRHQQQLIRQIKKMKKDVAKCDKKLQREAQDGRNLQDRETILYGKLSTAETELKNDQRDLGVLSRGKNPHKEQVKEIKIDIRTKKEELVELEKKQRLKIRKLERTQFWVKAFKEVRLYLMEQTLKHLEIVTNSILPELGLGEWNIYYEVERETKSGGISRGFNVIIVSPSLKKGPVPWESWSGGEGQRLRLAGAFALSEILLNQAGVDPDLEILDEPAHRLSPEGLRDLCAMLQDRARRLDRATWYIDHQSVEQVGFDSVVTVEKDGTGSHVQY
ncbi:hypothetical protein LCGC14_2355120, partial [marine sediment metagenome]